MSLHSKNNQGFTLVELLFSISIVAVILTVVILNQSTYTDSIALTNLADEISSTISQTQVYGISVKELSVGSNDFNTPYGLSFSQRTTPIPSPRNKSYILFADQNGNDKYNGTCSCSGECLKKVDISRGNFVNK